MTVQTDLKTDTLFINLGPQHPSTHGVLRIGLTVDGEIITKAEPDVGYLHRGTEKLSEMRDYHQLVVLSDRWDYVSAMSNNLAVCLAIEKLLPEVQVPKRAQHLRVLACELNRLASHLLFFGTYGIDIGAFTPFLHAFREREMILDLFEELCGARITYNYIRPGGVMLDLPEGWIAHCQKFLSYFKERIEEYNNLLSFNPLFQDRTKGVGVISKEQATSWGLSGPNLRGSGVSYDVRKAEPYLTYAELKFEIPLGQRGDCWDRYWCRMQEMVQSVSIAEQVLSSLPDDGPGKIPKLVKPPLGQGFAHIEASRGDLGIFIVSDGTDKPYRLHVKAPSFINLQVLQEALVGQKVADVIAILGSTDIVLGEVDR